MDDKQISAVLLIVIAITMTQVTFNDNYKIRVYGDTTKYLSLIDGHWSIVATETNNLFRGTTKLGKSSTNRLTVTDYNYDTNITTITRQLTYRNVGDDPTIIDTYTFYGNTSDIEDVPISHTVDIYNATGLIYEYLVEDLSYDGDTVKDIESPQEFGNNIKISYDDDYYYSKIYKYLLETKGKLIVRYRINSDYESYNMRVYDPPKNDWVKLVEINNGLFEDYIEYEITNPMSSDLKTTTKNKQNFDWYYIINKGNVSSDRFEICEPYTYDTPIYEEQEYDCSVNSTKTTCYKSIISSYEQHESCEWKVFNPTDYNFKSKNTYKVRHYINHDIAYGDDSREIDGIIQMAGNDYSEYAWWNSSWTYKKEIQINNTDLEASNYSLLLNITYSSNMQSNFSDIRFANGTETGELSYWIENYVDSSYADVWVKIPELGNTTNTTIYMYYGNSEVESESNFDNTFLKYFDDTDNILWWNFDTGTGTTITDLSGSGNSGTMQGDTSWVGLEGGQWDSRSDVKFSTGDSVNFLNTLSSDNNVIYTSNPVLSQKTAGTIEFWIKPDSINSPSEQWIIAEGGTGTGSTNAIVCRFIGDELQFILNTGISVTTTDANFANDIWYYITIVWDSTDMKLYVNDVEKASYGSSASTAEHLYCMGLGDGYGWSAIQQGFKGDIDNYKIYTRRLDRNEITSHFEFRKYLSTEPTYSFGPEETSVNEINISSCSTLDQEGYTYYLDTSILTSYSNNSVCMTVSNKNITLDCMNNTISNDIYAYGYGINISNNYTIIKNCIISNYSRGIQSLFNHNITLTSNNIIHNFMGVLIQESNNSIISNNNYYDNYVGFSTANDYDFYITKNYFEDKFQIYFEYLTYIFDNVFNSADIYISGNVNVYNNLFNSSDFDENNDVYYNTTKQIGTRIYSNGTYIGGNYWTNSTTNGYSDTCDDIDYDGFCDSPYEVYSGTYDYLPYSNEYRPVGIISPENKVYSSSSIQLNWTYDLDTNYTIAYYSLNGEPNISLYNWTVNESIINGLATRYEDLHYLNVNGNDRLIVLDTQGLQNSLVYYWDVNEWKLNSSEGNNDMPYMSLGSSKKSAVFNLNSNSKIVYRYGYGLTHKGLQFNGSGWSTNDTFAVGLPLTANSNERDCIEYMSYNNEDYIIRGEYLGNFKGYKYNSSDELELNSSIVNGLPDIGVDACPSIFKYSNMDVMITGENSGMFYGYIYENGQWVSNSYITNGLTDLGAVSVPSQIYFNSKHYLLTNYNFGTDLSSYSYEPQNPIITAKEGMNNLTLYIYYNYMLYSDIVYFTVDTTAPEIDIVSPKNYSEYQYTSMPLWFNISVSDDYSEIDSCWYNFNGLNNMTMIELNNSYFYTLNNSMTEGIYITNFYCNDTLNNVAHTNVEFIVNYTIAPTYTEKYITDFNLINDNMTIWIIASDDNSSIQTTNMFKYNDVYYDSINNNGNYSLTFNMTSGGSIIYVYLKDIVNNTNIILLEFNGADINVTYHTDYNYMMPDITFYDGLFPFTAEPAVTVYYNQGNGTDVILNITINESTDNCMDLYLYNKTLTDSSVLTTAYLYNASLDVHQICTLENNTSCNIYGWANLNNCTIGDSFDYEYWFDFYNVY